METPVRDRAVDADKGYRTYRYGKGEADDHSLDEQAEIHETPGSGTIGRGFLIQSALSDRRQALWIRVPYYPVDRALTSMLHTVPCTGVIR